MSSSNKVHPIYVALDANQYNRAIKLCLALPKENVLAQALLAHAYNKSMQRYKALLVLRSILGKEGFQELQLECQYSKEAWDQQQAAAAAAPPTPQPAAAPKKGKKGKKKPAPATSAGVAKPATEGATENRWSLADHLESPPAIDENWEKVPPVDQAITDETILGTLAITLQNLKLFLTSYQLYCWAASRLPVDLYIRKAFLNGLGVIVSPQYTSISKDVLANMQVLALQLGRISQHTGSARLATSWAAQTALWQLKLSATDTTIALNDDEAKKQQQRLTLLPRLAENLASKCADDPIDGELASSRREVYFLYLRTLEQQSKWQEMLDLLQSDIFKASEETGVSVAPKQQVLEKQAECMRKLENFAAARKLLEELLIDYPDNFSYWVGHLECSMAEHSEDDSGEAGLQSTEKFAQATVEKSDGDKYPKRGPRLISVEMATKRIKMIAEKKGNVPVPLVDKAIQTIMTYGNMFCPSVSCAFTDLEAYLITTLEHCNGDHMKRILKWLQELRETPESEDPAARRRQQRSYIFSVKMTHLVVAKRSELSEDWLPDWKDLVRTWKKTHSLEAPIQKESLPGDDLILLAIQQILRGKPDVKAFFVAAVLVEAGISNSPSNATLKIAALDIYSQLNAASRSWAIYQELQIKHIQLDTCTFLILPVLLSGGFYQEILKVSKGLLMLHTSVVRETSEFIGRAMDNGILSKADEFMFFQKEKMTNSLSAMEATGYILDSAPFFAHDVKDASLGVAHGIVGGETDFDRATDMVIEVRNPFGALSLLGRSLVATAFDNIADNRDQSILDYEALYQRERPTREDIINDSIRRGHSHSLLIRAALCVQYTKGPKKGKVVKPGEELVKCSEVLQAGIDSAREFSENLERPLLAELMRAQLELCRALLVVSIGAGLSDDTLEGRESQVMIHFRKASTLIKQATETSQYLNGKIDVAGVCRLLPGSIVPLFATFRMCAGLLEAFGWGKRKVKTKQIAAEFAKVAIELSVLTKAMLAAFSSEKIPDDPTLFSDLADSIEDAVVKEIRARIDDGREETQIRVRPHLEGISSFLDSFESATED